MGSVAEVPESPSSYKHVHSHDWITLLESGTTIENGTTGLRTWSASFVLAQYLERHSDILHARVLELGSGAGFLGIVIAKLQTQLLQKSSSTREAYISLSLSDVDRYVLQRCQDNLGLPCNKLNDHPDLSCRLLDWSDALDISMKGITENLLKAVDPDIIIGADLVYDIDIVSALVATLALALNRRTHSGRPSRISYLALTVRNEETVSAFRKAAGEVLDVHEKILNERSSLFANEYLEGRHGWPVRLFVLTCKTGT